MFKDELIIIRHGRSKHNIRADEDLDSGLTDFGIKQASNVGRFLAGLDLRGYHFFVSPFRRCLETAHQIGLHAQPGRVECVKHGPWWTECVQINQPFKIMSELREYLNHSGREATIPSLKCLYTKMNWDAFPQGGVTYQEEFNETFLHRMHRAHELLPLKSVVVTHGLPGILLAKIAVEPHLVNVPVWDYSLDNCSITIIRKGRMIWYGRNLYNELDYDAKYYRRDWDRFDELGGK